MEQKKLSREEILQKIKQRRKMALRAKELLEIIAQGKDPYTGEAFKDGQILKHERASKLCSYAAVFLGRALDEREGVRPNSLYVTRSAEYRNEDETVKTMVICFRAFQNGINPFDKSHAADDDPVKNDNFVRLFGFLADSFENVSFKKHTFYITEEQLEGFEYSDEPLTLKDIKQRLDALVDKDIFNGISIVLISNYLVGIQLLEEKTTASGKDKYRDPSAMGAKLGIIKEKYEHDGYENYRLKYNRRMQEFIVKNIPSMLESRRKKALDEETEEE